MHADTPEFDTKLTYTRLQALFIPKVPNRDVRAKIVRVVSDN